jgi:hypothetical protein
MTITSDPPTIRRLGERELRRLTVHPLCALLPRLEGVDRDRLRVSMATGYDENHPIVINQEGAILDGWNRRDVACELHLNDVPVLVRRFADDVELAAFIYRENVARRHLEVRDRAALAARLVNGGASVRAAATATNVPKSTVHRAAAAARETVPSGTSAERVTGIDGKSYPAKGRRASSGLTNPRVEIGKVGDRLNAMRTTLDRLVRSDPALSDGVRERARDYAAAARSLAVALEAFADGQLGAKTEK